MERMAVAPSRTIKAPEIRLIHSRWRGRILCRNRLITEESRNHQNEAPQKTPRIISVPCPNGRPAELTPTAANSATKMRIKAGFAKVTKNSERKSLHKLPFPARFRRICTTGFFRKITIPTIMTVIPPTALTITMLFSTKLITTDSEKKAAVAKIESAKATPNPETKPERRLLHRVR